MDEMAGGGVSHPTIKIISEGLQGQNTRVVFVDSDGSETDISACVQAVTLNLEVGKTNTADVSLLTVEGFVQGELADVVVRAVSPSDETVSKWKAMDE